MISITTIIIQIQAVRTSLFLSTISPWQYEERDTNHISLHLPYYTDPTTHGVSCGNKDLNSSLPVETQTNLFWSDPKNLAAHFNGRTSTTVFTKSSNSRDISSGYDVNHPLNSLQRPSSFISCPGVYYYRWWLLYPFCAGVRVYHLTMHLN